MEFKAPGKESLLKASVPPVASRTVRGRAPDAAGGHFMRVQPSKSFHPNDPLLQHGRFRIEFPSEGEIRMTSSESALFQVVYEYRIRIAPGSDVLEIENSLINTAPYERLLGVWSITRLDSFSLKRILLSAGNDSPAFRPEVAKHGDAVTLIRRSRNTELQTAIREKTPRDFFELRAWPETAGLVAESRNGTRLQIKYQTLRRNRKQEASLHLFLCDRFSEMESHGPTRLLKPGQRISLMERWRLL